MDDGMEKTISGKDRALHIAYLRYLVLVGMIDAMSVSDLVSSDVVEKDRVMFHAMVRQDVPRCNKDDALSFLSKETGMDHAVVLKWFNEQTVVRWDKHPEIERCLNEAGWRYTNLIGITASESVLKYLEQDQARYSHFIKTDSPSGLPVYDQSDAAVFVSDISGFGSVLSNLWMRHDWH